MAQWFKQWFKKHPAAKLPVLCYALGVLVLLAVCLGSLAANRIAYATGRLQTARLSLADFELRDLEQQADGSLLCTSGDPQLVLKDAARAVESLHLQASYAAPPLKVNAFWAKPGQNHSLRQMAYPRQGSESAVQSFWLPPLGGQSLRLDPGIVPGNMVTIESIEINIPRPFWAFLLPSFTQWLLLAVLPGLVACGLAVLKQLGLWPRRKRGAGHA